MLLNCFTISLLLLRKIKLANHQGAFIVNLAVSDLLVSAIGVLRGLGIINSKFVGAPDNIANPFCAGYAILIFSFGVSGMSALLPLTIDRALAVVLPLRHSSIINKKTCRIMFLATWLSILTVLVDNIVRYKIGAISIEYSERYHRCVMFGKGLIIQDTLLFIIPFFLVLLTYSVMLIIIIKTKKSCGQFLVVSVAIIATNLLAYSPTVIINMAQNYEMSYEVSQVLFATLWYINGVANPLIYVAVHPKTRKYFSSCWQKRSGNAKPSNTARRKNNITRNDRIAAVSPNNVIVRGVETQIGTETSSV